MPIDRGRAPRADPTPRDDGTAPRPVMGVLCCNEVAGRSVQAVADRFVAPLARYADATVLLVPAIASVNDPRAVAGLLDGLLLTGSRSHVAPGRYRPDAAAPAFPVDEQRDEVALRLAEAMIDAGKPVFGICRGLQELNVLFGGTLTDAASAGGHHAGSWDAGYDRLMEHRHEVLLTDGGVLSRITGEVRFTVSSVHEQGIDRLGAGLLTEAVAAQDGLIEAVSAHGCGAEVLAVQWHPEWDVEHSPASRAFFARIGRSLRLSAWRPLSGAPLPPDFRPEGSGGRRVGH